MDSTQTKQQHFMALYEPLHARLCRFVQTLIWDKEEAKDIVSETILVTYEKMEQVRDKEALLAFMFSVAANLVNKKLRRKKFWAWFDPVSAHTRQDNGGSDHSLMLHELNLALQKLPQKQREALVWYEVGGLTMEQIAALHNMSIEGVKSSISRARKTLAKQLEWKEELSINAKGVWYER